MFIPAVVRVTVLVIMPMFIGCGFSEDIQRRQDAIPAPSVPPSATLPGPSVAFFYFGEVHSFTADESFGCDLTQGGEHYSVFLAGAGIDFLLELDFPPNEVKGGTYDASSQADVTGGTYLAHGTATVADDLESGTFELTTTDDRPVTGSWIC